MISHGIKEKQAMNLKESKKSAWSEEGEGMGGKETKRGFGERKEKVKSCNYNITSKK